MASRPSSEYSTHQHDAASNNTNHGARPAEEDLSDTISTIAASASSDLRHIVSEEKQDGTNESRPLVKSEQSEEVNNRLGQDPETASTSGSLATREVPSLIGWDSEQDVDNPKNFKIITKLTIGVVMGTMNYIVSFAISIFSGVLPQVADEVDYDEGMMELCVSLFIFGLAFGPLFFGPASEFYGRKRPIICGMTGFVAFTLLTTTTRDLAPMIIFRFFSGFCGSAAYVVPPGLFVDLYGPVGRAIGYAVFASAAFLGGSLGPGVGAMIIDGLKLKWQWSLWITALVAALPTIAMVFLPESLEAEIFSRKAKRLRLQTGDWTLRSPREEKPVQLHNYLVKPWQMLIREPVLMVVTMAFALDYGIQSLTYSGIPTAFEQLRGWSYISSTWALFITIPGFVLGCVAVVVDTKLRFQKQLVRGRLIEPEKRLPPMIAGMTILSVGLLFFAHESSRSSSMKEQAVAEVMIGTGMYMVWQTATVYVQDLYVEHANSALAACACVRYSVGAMFPTFAPGLYLKMGVQWTIALNGILCGVLIPCSVAFFLYGRKLRSWSKFALQSRLHLEDPEGPDREE